jgi:hypothetical protein
MPIVPCDESELILLNPAHSLRSTGKEGEAARRCQLNKVGRLEIHDLLIVLDQQE